MKTLAAFLISALVALLALAAAFLALERACAGIGLAPLTAPPQIRVEWHEQSQPQAALVQLASFRSEESLPLHLMLIQDGQGTANATATPQERLLRFLCELRASDLVVLAGVVFLLLIGVFQGLWIRRAARAAKESAALADIALLATQRPYVLLKDIKVSLTKNPVNDEIQTCTLQPIWENTGSTPTKNGRSHINWKYFEGSVPEDFDFADFDDLGNRILSQDGYRPLVVGPKSTAISPVINLDPATLRQIRDRQGKLLVWGFVEYDEIFPAAPRHRTEFCYEVAVTGSPAHHVGFNQYHRHNGVDGDCLNRGAKKAA